MISARPSTAVPFAIALSTYQPVSGGLQIRCKFAAVRCLDQVSGADMSTISSCFRGVILILFFGFPACSAQCTGSQEYEFTFDMNWSPSVDTVIPPNAGYSRVIAIAHTSKYVLFEETAKASDAVGGVATSGETETFKRDAQGVVNEKLASDFTVAGKRKNGPTDSVKFTLKLDGDMNSTYVSVLARLDPSPAWFVGARAFPLCDYKHKVFMAENEQDLTGYNSGLEKGTSYTSSHDMYDTENRKEIFIIKEVNVKKYGVLKMVQTSGGGKAVKVWHALLIAFAVLLICAAAVYCVFRRIKKYSSVPVPNNNMSDLEGEEGW